MRRNSVYMLFRDTPNAALFVLKTKCNNQCRLFTRTIVGNSLTEKKKKKHMNLFDMKVFHMWILHVSQDLTEFICSTWSYGFHMGFTWEFYVCFTCDQMCFTWEYTYFTCDLMGFTQECSKSSHFTSAKHMYKMWSSCVFSVRLSDFLFLPLKLKMLLMDRFNNTFTLHCRSWCQIPVCWLYPAYIFF